MPAQDTSQLKEKIISILRIRGPSLPVHVAKETGLSMLFASAFLSELFSEKKIEISNMKVGSSPVYFLPGQRSKLENFSHYLKSKEKDAFELLKEKKFLKDREQEPAIRVALRAIKDFAIPFKKEEEIFWRYFIIPQEEFIIKKEIPLKKEIEIPKKEETQSKEEKIITEEIQKELPKEELDIFEKSKEKEKKKVTKKKTTSKKKKDSEKLFKKVKEFLSKESIEIIDFQNISKDELILKIRENEKEKMLIAYKKKRVTESDIIKTYKKIENKNIPYILLMRGEPSKKLSDLIETMKRLDKVKDMENTNN